MSYILLNGDSGKRVYVNTLFKSISYVVSVLLVIVAVGLAFVAIPWFDNKALIVRSGSMEPTIKVGDLVVVNSKGEGLVYKEGDIIAFKGEKDPKILTTHRIVATQTKDGKLFYQTKGDANNAPDNGLVAQENVVGKTIFLLPYVGRLFAFTKSNIGFPLLVIFPALFVIVLEVVNIFKEIKRQRGRSQGPLSPSVSLNSLIVLIPLVISGLFIQNSHAFFSDTATSTNNVFTAGQFGHIVINEVSSDGQAKGEWVELFNPTGSSIDVSGWKIADKNAFDTGQDDAFPTVSPIPSGGYAVVITNQSTVASIPPSAITITLTSANIGSGLNDDGDAVVIKNSSNVIIDSMSYGNETVIFASPPPAPASGQSLARSPNGVDTDTTADWVVDTSPSIGVAN